MKPINKLFIIFISSILFCSTTIWAKDLVNTGFFNDDALSGYDPVAYFTMGTPVKGKKAFQYNYQDANWYFSTLVNLKKFELNPKKYTPQYGGYCAWAVAQGNTADANPKNWTIYQNKLYLNYNSTIQNKWLDNIEQFISEADQKWPAVLD
ncbi:MAG: YHS domain-containing protein [Deltaproteobacteria bacterium]|jgi:YHS domain-containing protein|nr:YHS domain-containing protein [Deltaproteobacteria bacterium]MBT4527420.1 YHS domain-containing protein [Deltaproteobacteria bacterium]